MNNFKIINTKDGSHTIYSPKFDSTYHSTFGAIQESQHIFLQEGLEYYVQKYKTGNVKILEYGFGTGLNAFLSFIYSLENGIKIEYVGIEKYPIPVEVAKQLNYLDVLGKEHLNEQFATMHRQEQMTVQLNDNFSLEKCNKSFNNFDSDVLFDIVYFDVFSFDVQDYVWQRPFLNKVYNRLKEGGILTTYGAKGLFKRELKALGFTLEHPAGPTGKREITRAIKSK